MRFLLTMNMSSAKGHPVHQLTVEHKSPSIKDFWAHLSDNEFIICTLLYKVDGEWIDRGQVILNTGCIGKAQELVDYYGADNEHYRTN